MVEGVSAKGPHTLLEHFRGRSGWILRHRAEDLAHERGRFRGDLRNHREQCRLTLGRVNLAAKTLDELPLPDALARAPHLRRAGVHLRHHDAVYALDRIGQPPTDGVHATARVGKDVPERLHPTVVVRVKGGGRPLASLVFWSPCTKPRIPCCDSWSLSRSTSR